MFDFTNNTFNGILLFISTLLGLGYPLILGCIEKIDTKYHSTLLTRRFKNERLFNAFKMILALNIAISFILPFLLDGNTHARWFISLQVISVIILIVTTFRLLSLLLQYYDIIDLQNKIMEDFKHSRDKGNTDEESIYFAQWTDLTPGMLSSADEELSMKVYDTVQNYFDYFYSHHSKDEYNIFPEYFYGCISRVNENLCKTERRPFTINNSNSIIIRLLSNDLKIANDTYNCIWRNIVIQIFYGREDWIIKYWEAASEDFSTYKYRIDEKDKQYEIKKDRFYEFHIMLCAMLLREKKYSVLKKILYYTSSEPETYPLVPSTFYDIIHKYIDINNKFDANPMYFNKHYRMPNIYGYADSTILGAANLFLTLLIFRLYNINWYYGYDYVISLSNIKNASGDYGKIKEYLDSIEYWIKHIKSNNQYMEAINVKDFVTLINRKSVDYNMFIYTPSMLVQQAKEDLERFRRRDLEIKEYDPVKVENIYKGINDKIKSLLDTYKDFTSKQAYEGEMFGLNSAKSIFFPNEAFYESTNIDYVDIDDVVSSYVKNEFIRSFAGRFYVNPNNTYINVLSSDIFKAIDRLVIDNTYTIVSFGIYWESFIGRDNDLEKGTDNGYSYKKIKILNLPCRTDEYAQKIYILKTIDLPYISYKEPSAELKETRSLEELSLSPNIWISLSKLNTLDPHNISEDDLKRLGNDVGITSILTIAWYPILNFKKSFNILCLSVKYKSLDEGNTMNVDQIKTFDDMSTKNKPLSKKSQK